MTEEQYRKTTDFFRKTKRREKLAAGITEFLPDAIAAAYPIAVIVLGVQRNPGFWRFVLVPLITLILVTILRHLFHAPRPYDQMSFEPLVSHKPGNSFPSRHTASAVIIAAAFWYLSWPLGLIAGILAVIVGISRVAAGLHYPKDVAAGAGISLAAGIIGFWLL